MGMETHLDKRLHNLNMLRAFSVLGSQAAAPQDAINMSLTRKHENQLLQEWSSFKNHVLTGAFKVQTDPRKQLL
ncbi:hypothetical protein DPEC_G00073890 [Dallia pectoralis]|uniref:Uncharacterized protein n=1 Tax=Dallia pectoralis TaxID=75939 RepID=A0ACC2H3R5_DALPE|nr:hypothetical protein DPEC_G00073890 [Dallia pectoralis]